MCLLGLATTAKHVSVYSSTSNPKFSQLFVSPDDSIKLSERGHLKFFPQSESQKAHVILCNKKPSIDPNSNLGRWTDEEHNIFVDSFEKYGKNWKKIATIVKTRTILQIRTHAQKYVLKIKRVQNKDLVSDNLSTQLPRKTLHAENVTIVEDLFSGIKLDNLRSKIDQPQPPKFVISNRGGIIMETITDFYLDELFPFIGKSVDIFEDGRLFDALQGNEIIDCTMSDFEVEQARNFFDGPAVNFM